MNGRYPADVVRRELERIKDDIYFNANLREFAVPAATSLDEMDAHTEAFQAAQKAALAKYHDPAMQSLAQGPCGHCGQPFEYFTKFPTDAGCVNLVGPWDLCDRCFKAEQRRKQQEQERIEQEAREVAQQQRRHVEHIQAFWSNNPEADHYCNETGNPPCPEQYAEVQAFDPEDRDDGRERYSGAVLLGPSFRGKTTSAYHYLKSRAELDETCLVITSADLNGIPEAVRAGRDAFRELTEPWYSADVLLVDDCDKCNITPRVASELWNLFEKRLRSRYLLTIVTLNTCTKQGFLNLFMRKGEDCTSTGISIFNRLKLHCKFIHFK